MDEQFDPTQAMEMLRSGIDANTEALNSVLLKIRDALNAGINQNGAALKRVQTKLTKTLNRGVAANDQALNSVIGKLTSTMVDGIANNELALNRFMQRATVGVPTAGGGIEPGPSVGPSGIAQFRLYIKCSNQQLGAFLADNDPAMLAQAGWTLAVTQLFGSQAAAIQYGRANLARIFSSVCPVAPSRPLYGAQLPGMPLPPSVSTPATPTLPPRLAIPPGSVPTRDQTLYLYWSCSGQNGVPGVFVIFDPSVDSPEDMQATIAQYGLNELEPFPKTALDQMVTWIKTKGHLFLEDHGCRKGLVF